MGEAFGLRGISVGGGSIGSSCARALCIEPLLNNGSIGAQARSAAVARRQKLLPRKYLDSGIGRDIFVGLRAFALACS